jgi:hypothetical protein
MFFISVINATVKKLKFYEESKIIYFTFRLNN